MRISSDARTFDAIRQDDRQAFGALFHEMYKPLVSHAFRFTREVATSENIVQDVFLKLWNQRHELVITTSMEHYLFRSVRNHCLNHLDKIKVRSEYLKMMTERSSEDDYSAFYPEPDLLAKIEAAISNLPEKRQEIFRLAREEGLKYREIADKLDISVKTVEAQITQALKQLREALKKYNTPLLFFMLCSKGKSG